MSYNIPILSNESGSDIDFEDEKDNKIIDNDKLIIDKLIELHLAIRQLSVTLPVEDDPDAKKDGQKLSKLMLQDNKWDLVKKLIEILEPFNSATEYFSAGQYPIIAYIHPVMEAIKAHYTKNIDPDEYDYNNEEMSFANAETHNNTINEYRLQLRQLMNIQLPTSNKNVTSSSSKNLSPNNMFKELIFGSAQRSDEFTDELDSYLDLRQTPLAFPKKDPFLWW
ncbi:10604_t:CDS:2 [Cetraspora pellucida]|uniref:10604_t:CDS:1 n=1 Tax=Cetraspora pellucida TaxID=1433469 RepID=A0ACA9K9M3_9GLOM|nr:10604_t:CDS:2 [Cetraspora pellucida]